MKKLDKKTILERDDIAGRLSTGYQTLSGAVDTFNTARQTLWEALEAAIEAYNDGVEAAWEPLSDAQADYNEIVNEAGEWKTDVVTSIDDYMADKSEKWKEGDRGQAYEAWKSALEDDFELSEIEQPEAVTVEEPEEIDFGLEEASEKLEQMPTEVDGE